MNNNKSNKIIMVENDEVVAMNMLRKSSDYEDLRLKIVESTIMSGILH